jgi:hypothetical protein
LGNTNQELKEQRWEFANRLAKEIANKDQVMREKEELLERLREDGKQFNASQEYAAYMAACEAKTSKELELKEQTIKHSEELISMLKAEIESANEACLSYKAQLAAADRGYGAAKDSKIRVDQRCNDLEKEHAREHNRLSAQLQQALKQQKLAEENSGTLVARLQARDEEVDLRAQLERECQILTEELTEAREAKAKLEMENKEDRTRMAGFLWSADVTARDERMKCKRAEEELRVWRDQDGVIALD